jgi:twitching motility two-component system response regulator PilG
MKVLLVDDTRTLLSLIQVYLMGWSIDFIEARDGLEGLKKAKEHRPDLVISDVRMPGMDGFELTAALRSDPQLHATPVVLLTSLNDEASRRKGRLVGATTFLTKPVSVEELRRQVGTILKLPAKKGAR